MTDEIRGEITGAEHPWTVITCDRADQPLGEGEFSDYPTLEEAARAFATLPGIYRQIVYDDDQDARFLTRDEQAVVDRIVAEHDLEAVDVEVIE